MTRFATACLIALLAVPAGALAQGGVVVDPDSPAGTEYAIPLEEARREATGGGGSSSGGGESSSGGGGAGGQTTGEQALFGEGIEQAPEAPAAADDASGGAATRGSGSRRDRADRKERRGRDSGGGPLPPETVIPKASTPAAVEAAASSGSDMALTAGIVAAVLGFGLLGGLGFRRLSRTE
jgi:hypothetical protein